MRNTILIALLCWFSAVIAQESPDSLYQVLQESVEDTSRVKALIDLGDYYELSNPDSALHYYNLAHYAAKNCGSLFFQAKSLKYSGIVFWRLGLLDKALDFYTRSYNAEKEISQSKDSLKALEGLKGMSDCLNNMGLVFSGMGKYDSALVQYFEAERLKLLIDDQKGLSNTYNNIGLVYNSHSQYDKAIDYYQRSAAIRQATGNKQGLIWCYNNIGAVYNTLGNFALSLEYYQKSFSISEEFNDLAGMSYCYRNIGEVHRKQKNYDMGIDYLKRSLKISEEIGDKRGTATCLMRIGLIHWNTGEPDSALTYYNNSLLVATEIGDSYCISGCLSNIGLIYDSKEQYPEALVYYEKAVVIFRDIGDLNGLAIVLDHISDLKLALAEDKTLNKSQKNKYYQEAVDYGLESLEIATQIGAIPVVNNASDHLMKAYKALGNPVLAFKYAEIYIESSDSLFSEQNTKVVKEMEAQYQNEKKQLEIEKLAQQNQLNVLIISKQDEIAKRQRVLIFSFIAGFLIVLVFSVLLYRTFLQKKKANILLEKQKAEIADKNDELKLQNEEISAQRDEIETQRDTVTQQRDRIEEINQELTDSIHYAKRIQGAILPQKELMDEHLKNYFVLFKPKDIVSGDFFWMTYIEERTIFAVADCTGHGVPGAFMSMLGAAFLNEIVNKEYITHTGVILRRLRKAVIKALQQKGIEEESGEMKVKDGMDIAICSLNKDRSELQFSGANNPLYLIRDNSGEVLQHDRKLDGAKRTLYEIKGDKMPIAIYDRMDKFSHADIKLNEGDNIYLFSDGYADQFGGSNGKKYKYNALKQMLLLHSAERMEDQQKALLESLESWMSFKNNETGKTYEQVDDIVIMGVKI